jgi:hypothetical protein
MLTSSGHSLIRLLVRSDNRFYNPSTAHRKDLGFS